MQIFLYLSVNFMFDFGILQKGKWSCDPLLNNWIRVIAGVVALLACRRVEFFLVVSIRFGLGSFCIQIGMASPVIANGFHLRSEAGLLRGRIILLRF